ncbi:hypothetical protein GE21DRAFT_3241 [Neurospora crassa]|uniref:Uncharacterized protein n=2 Tax=Neurospora crassa TaxID=5141 RepID=Q1K5P8_NEUCR|nr:hypothetical protein NCU01781 [Neurospora crassa OR74A]EAA27968.1 hypothetical protein NCU01781 [Neurospora crassa OR74A]KHE83601.1 hypothetical protein GE21DRAFT_3241 [Neurospora crassa]CAD21198.1 related to nuclear protein sdk2 [Neurospora crassa]|eukprot:XP_957204.1 hypothetical protein NCU01781 [Neurospora crassa OR74A]
MSFTKWFKGSGSGTNDKGGPSLKNSHQKKKRSEDEDHCTQGDMEGYVYDHNYHYQPAPGLQPQGYGYSQRMAAKPRKPRLAAQEGHFDAEELTRRLLDVLAEQKTHEIKKQRMREARTVAAATDPATQWQQRQEAAISALNRAPTAAGRTTGLRKPSKSYTDNDSEAAPEEQEHRHVPKDATRTFKQADTNKAICRQDKLDKQAQGEHRRQISEHIVEVPMEECIRALPYQTQTRLTLADEKRLKREQILNEASPAGHKAHGQTVVEKVKRRHDLNLEGALSRISVTCASETNIGERGHSTAASEPAISATSGKQQSRERSKEPEFAIFPHSLATRTMTTMQDQATSRQGHQPGAPSAAAPQTAPEKNTNSVETTLSSENDDLSALPSPTTTQSQSQSLSKRFRASPFVNKSPSLLNLRQKLGMTGGSGFGSGSGSGSSGSPGSPVTGNSSGSGSELSTATTGISRGEEAATSPLTAASSCRAGAGADNQPQTQTQQGWGLLKKTATGMGQEKEKTRMKSKKSGFFAKLGGSVKKGMF